MRACGGNRVTGTTRNTPHLRFHHALRSTSSERATHHCGYGRSKKQFPPSLPSRPSEYLLRACHPSLRLRTEQEKQFPPTLQTRPSYQKACQRPPPAKSSGVVPFHCGRLYSKMQLSSPHCAPAHTNPKRKRGRELDLPSLTLRVGVRRAVAHLRGWCAMRVRGPATDAAPTIHPPRVACGHAGRGGVPWRPHAWARP
jgi:hypothetical protein